MDQPQNKAEYRGHYARLAKEFADLPRVVVQHAAKLDSLADPTLHLGQLQTLDLRQDDGYGVGVMVDLLPSGATFKFGQYSAERVRLFSEYRDQLMQFFTRGAISDGDLIGKSHRTVLVQLGLAQRAGNGWNIITAAGVAEVERAGWAHA